MPGEGGGVLCGVDLGGEQCVDIAPRHVGLRSNALLGAGACSECRFPGSLGGELQRTP